LNKFFSTIDFGEKANQFLKLCGIKNEPSSLKLAELLVKSSNEFWDSIEKDHKKYLEILQKIAIFFNSIKEPSLIVKMKRASILLAVRKKYSNSNSEKINSFKEVDQYCLASAKKIFINDDTIYQQVFNPLLVLNKLLENFYKVCHLLLSLS